MWVSFLLTCLVIDNGLCKFDHSTDPESISSFRDHGVLPLDEPQAIQPLDWRMPREESETTVRKKKKTRKEKLEELARLPPPFDWVACNEPLENDKKMVFDAVRTLKRRNGDRFIKDQEKNYMIQIQEYQLERFLALFKMGGSDGKGILGMDESSSAASTAKSHVIRHDIKREAVKALLPASSQVPEFRSKYADQVMEYFEPLVLQIKAKMLNGNSAKRNKLRLEYFDHLLTFLPLYLFHVDMINVVIPELMFDGQATLEAQRQNAGQKFLQHAMKLVEENDRYLRNEEVLFQDGRKKHYYQVNHPSSFFWGIVQDWIASSRGSLANVIIDNDNNKMNSVFKQFFNEILAGFIEHLSQTSVQTATF
ncbi:hypothetical protein PGT21_033645 [Puccinia graminis f. sp. tritici]|uniref:Uncharacterized protein n=2 Tax=Puccinia graminis f. sp. tritici TaxID=56615 RepID=A0A5B0LNP7_PUCGR|nr:hypothetical protein PGT21_033645 [Puccinia graminis f. sp. tritici]